MCRNRHRKQISILIPFQSDDPVRLRTFDWLYRYWSFQLPDAEIVVGHDWESQHHWYWPWRKPFSKAVAVNDAFRRSHGDIIAIVDADAYLPGEILTHCAERIRMALRSDVHLWFVPYRSLYRLTPEASRLILQSSPGDPLQLPTPPPPVDVEGTDGSGHGHFFGALAQVMPRRAFETVGGMDPRFRGWGSEDVAFLKALDVLWGRHSKTSNDVLHLWHPQISQGTWTDVRGETWKVRMWEGQTAPRANDQLARRYFHATGDPVKMRQLVDEYK